MAVRRKLIREAVEILLAERGITHAPIPVEAIARSLGIKLQLDEVDDDLSGFIVREKGHTVIGANRSHHPHRRRFTIAHELGHYVFHQGHTVHLDNQRDAFRVNLRNAASSRGEDDDEKEANLFAAELLMPEKFLRQDLEGVDLDLLSEDDFLQKLARRYRVSVQALIFRLAYLRYITL